MWKKDETEKAESTPRQSAMQASRPSPAPAPEGGRKVATIGGSITIKGEVSGDEDLLIQGHIDGSVDLKKHAVTVGPDGRVKAGIKARVVTVEGTVEGDLEAGEQVILRSGADVEGDISAPSVVLEDGARFRGGIDMGEEPAKGSSGGSRGSSTSSSSSGSSGSSGASGASGSAKSGSSASGGGSGKGGPGADDAAQRSLDTRTGKADKAGATA